MLRGLLLGTILGIGIYPLVQFVWDKLWGYLLPRVGGGDMTIPEAELLRGGVALVLVIIVCYLLYRWDKRERDKKEMNKIEVIKKAIREACEHERQRQDSTTGGASGINHKKPGETNVNQ